MEKGLISTSGKTPEATMSSLIIMDIKNNKKKSPFIRIKPGRFALNPNYANEESNKKEKQESMEGERGENKTKNSRYIGTAGEYRVISELLFKGYNANPVTVDEGIDITATKNDKQYNIQVKTSNEKNGKYLCDMNVKSYQKYKSASTFYVFVLHGKVVNFLILPWIEIQKNIDQDNILMINHGKGYRANIHLKNKKIYLGKFRNEVTYYNNNWNLIK